MTTAARVFAFALGAYLVVRGVAELFLVDYGDPSSYAKDWGGPSLVGVLAVHSGPGLVVLGLVARRAMSAKLVRK